MAQRFCAGCGTEVEDVGGYCLLGHSLRLVPGDLQDIQADIASAFEAASGRMEAAFRLAGLPQDPKPPQFVIDGPPQEKPAPVAEAASPLPPAAAAPPQPPPASPDSLVAGRQARAPVHLSPTGGHTLWGPPPPPEPPAPHPEEAASRWEHLWGPAAPDDVLGDPITAFSPAPSMDWGPEKDGKRKLLSRRPGQKSA